MQLGPGKGTSPGTRPRCPITFRAAFWSPRLSVPRLAARASKRGRTHARSIRSGRSHYRRDNARTRTAPAPQPRPVTHTSRLAAQVCANGDIKASAENPDRRTSVLPTLLLSRAAMCIRLKSLLGLVRGCGHRLIPRPQPGRLRQALPAGEPMSMTATPRGRHGGLAHPLILPIEPHHPPGLRGKRTRSGQLPSASTAARSYKSIRPTSVPTCSFGDRAGGLSGDRGAGSQAAVSRPLVVVHPRVAVDLQLLDHLDPVEAGDAPQSPQTLQREAQ